MFSKLDLKAILEQIKVKDTYRFEVTEKKKREKIQRKIKAIIEEHNLRHIGKEYVRAIGNAVKHGQCPVKCHIYIGKNKHTVITIQDAGQGFDYNDVVHKFEKGQKYFHHHGCGTRSYAHNERLLVDWEDNGRKIILYYQ